MENINTVTISTAEYKRLIIDAERGKLKEDEIIAKLKASGNDPIDNNMEEVDRWRSEYLKMQGRYNALEDAYKRLLCEIGKIPPKKKHWWS